VIVPTTNSTARRPGSVEMRLLAASVDSIWSRWPSAPPPAELHLFRRFQHGPVELEIIAGHTRGGKALFEPAPHGMTIEGQHARQGLDRLLRRRDDAAGHSFIDDFRHGAASKCQHRRPASDGFYQRKAERFWPVDRKQQRARVAEKRRFSPFVDFANELHIRPGQKR